MIPPTLPTLLRTGDERGQRPGHRRSRRQAADRNADPDQRLGRHCARAPRPECPARRAVPPISTMRRTALASQPRFTRKSTSQPPMARSVERGEEPGHAGVQQTSAADRCAARRQIASAANRAAGKRRSCRRQSPAPGPAPCAAQAAGRSEDACSSSLLPRGLRTAESAM